MASIGLSKPYVAKYAVESGTVSYSAGTVLGGAVDFSASIESGDDNNLYADNGVKESDRGFTKGTLSITTDDLTQEGSALILGITESAVTVEGLTEAKELIYNDDMSVPYLGFGVIIKKKKNGVYKYRAVVFTKVMFNLPEDAASTQEDTIEWKTPVLEATIMRDDSSKHAWKRESTFDSEADAESYIKGCLNITAA